MYIYIYIHTCICMHIYTYVYESGLAAMRFTVGHYVPKAVE